MPPRALGWHHPHFLWRVNTFEKTCMGPIELSLLSMVAAASQPVIYMDNYRDNWDCRWWLRAAVKKGSWVSKRRVLASQPKYHLSASHSEPLQNAATYNTYRRNTHPTHLIDNSHHIDNNNLIDNSHLMLYLHVCKPCCKVQKTWSAEYCAAYSSYQRPAVVDSCISSDNNTNCSGTADIHQTRQS